MSTAMSSASRHYWNRRRTLALANGSMTSKSSSVRVADKANVGVA